MAANSPSIVEPQVSGNVAAFAAKEGVEAYLPRVLEMTRRVFPGARRMAVVVEEDAEIEDYFRIVFEVDVPLSVPEGYAAQRRWSHELFQCCPSTHVWVFNLSMHVVK